MSKGRLKTKTKISEQLNIFYQNGKYIYQNKESGRFYCLFLMIMTILTPPSSYLSNRVKIVLFFALIIIALLRFGSNAFKKYI